MEKNERYGAFYKSKRKSRKKQKKREREKEEEERGESMCERGREGRRLCVGYEGEERDKGGLELSEPYSGLLPWKKRKRKKERNWGKKREREEKRKGVLL